ncbi:hypothetical protein HAX54_037761 [Datura stramonium]|uniref:Uncharacterized protein n=1 Tax=Datura stramonium TaxID=4076 RepID=A0ABS8RR28_DATST|nr:hypothetical protein [Datura stramonium]
MIREMVEDKIVTVKSFSMDRDDDITADEIPPENNLTTGAYRIMWFERKIREIIQCIEYKITELEAKRSQLDAKTSAVVAKLTARIEFLLSDRDVMQKNLDEFLMKLSNQQREGTFSCHLIFTFFSSAILPIRYLFIRFRDIQRGQGDNDL